MIAGTVGIVMAAGGCHRARAAPAETPAPVTEAAADTAAPDRTDRQWIDSVAASWAGSPAPQPAPVASARAPRGATDAQQAGRDSTITMTSFADTRLTPPAEAGARTPSHPDDPVPVEVLAAIGVAGLAALAGAWRLWIIPGA